MEAQEKSLHQCPQREVGGVWVSIKTGAEPDTGHASPLSWAKESFQGPGGKVWEKQSSLRVTDQSPQQAWVPSQARQGLLGRWGRPRKCGRWQGHVQAALGGRPEGAGLTHLPFTFLKLIAENCSLGPRVSSGLQAKPFLAGLRQLFSAEAHWAGVLASAGQCQPPGSPE